MPDTRDQHSVTIRTRPKDQVPITAAQAAALDGPGLLRYCQRCRVVWPWKGGPDPCPRCAVHR